MLRTRGSGDGRESGELKLERSLHRIAALSYFTDPRFLVWLLGFNANDVISSRLVTQDRLGGRAFPRDQDGLVERLSDLAHESAHGIELPLAYDFTRVEIELDLVVLEEVAVDGDPLHRPDLQQQTVRARLHGVLKNAERET